MENDSDMDPPVSSQSASLWVPKIEVEPDSHTESDSEIEALSAGNKLNNIPNINNICKKALLTLILSVCMSM